MYYDFVRIIDNKDKINQIKKLRQHGYSLPEISKITHISKTTVFRYIKDVKILPKYISEWAGKRGGSRKRKLLKENFAFEQGIKFVGDLSYRDKLLILCALYWAEGSKRDFGLSNTDPELIKIFVKSLREVLNIDIARLRVSIRIYEDLDREECLDYWSKIVDIPKDKFVNINVLPGKKKGKLKYGMCRIRILKGGDTLKKINGIIKAVQQSFAPIA